MARCADFSKFSTLICVFTLDRIGRRWTLYWGSVGQGICMFAAGGLARATQNATDKSVVGGFATMFVFLFTGTFLEDTMSGLFRTPFSIHLNELSC